MVEEGRTRVTRARRKQAQALAKWDAELNKWQKFAKCSICRIRFVVNNYPDQKVRVKKYKIAGKIVCPWCQGRDAKYLIQLRLIVEQVAEEPCPKRHNVPYSKSAMDSFFEDLDRTCKCKAHVAKRVLAAHDELPSRR
jgi:hypothetical protein